MAQSTNAIDQFTGLLKFETEWLYFIPEGRRATFELRRNGPDGPIACCTDAIRHHFDIPPGTTRMTLVFSTNPNEGIECYEGNFRYFVEQAREDAGYRDDCDRVWYWWPCFDVEPAKDEEEFDEFDPVALDEYTGTRKIETEKLYFHGQGYKTGDPEYESYFWLRNESGETVCCTPDIVDEYIIPPGTRWISLIFSSNRNEGIRCIEHGCKTFVRNAMNDAGIESDPYRVWYWSVGLPG